MSTDTFDIDGHITEANLPELRKKALVHIAVERRFWHGLSRLEPACGVRLKAHAITHPNPGARLEEPFISYKKYWPVLQRWLQEKNKPSRVILTVTKPGKNLTETFECAAILNHYEVTQQDNQRRPDIIRGLLFMHILSSEKLILDEKQSA